jgi:hypothetical protein
MVKIQKTGQVILGILFVIYLIMGYPTPEPLANLIATVPGKIVVIIIAALLFVVANPILAILGVVVAYDLIRRSMVVTGIDALKKYLPTQEKIDSQFSAFNQFPYTLEQEMVKKMTPDNAPNEVFSSPPTFKPILDNTRDAAAV